MAAVIPRVRVSAPSRAPLKHGLLDVVSWRTETDPHWQMGVEWDSQGCEPLQARIHADDDPIEKTLEARPEHETADPFTLYGDFACSAITYTPAEAEDFAADRLQLREGFGLETAFWAILGDTEPETIADIPTAEDWIAESYGSQGLIHMSRSEALRQIKEGYLEVSSSILRTKLGTQVVAGGGYGEGIYVTSGLSGYQSEIFTSSNNPADLYDVRKNDLYAVAERTYTIMRECAVGRIEGAQ